MAGVGFDAAETIAGISSAGLLERIDQVPVFRAYGHGVVHEGTYSERNGGEFAGIAVGWLNWQLKGDQQASHLFVGPSCGLCANPHWVVRSKKLH